MSSENYSGKQRSELKMRPSSNPRVKPTESQLAWAREAVKDVFLVCVLNITLKNGDVCQKYLHEMNSTEACEYFRMVNDLFDVDKKKS